MIATEALISVTAHDQVISISVAAIHSISDHVESSESTHIAFGLRYRQSDGSRADSVVEHDQASYSAIGVLVFDVFRVITNV
jgi:hypothetical protein